MKVPLGKPQRPLFTAGDKNSSDPVRSDARLRVLAAALTYVRRCALMAATVGAALLIAGTVAVVRAELSAQSHGPVSLGTSPWFICGEDGDTNTLSCPHPGDLTGEITAGSHRKQEGRKWLRSISVVRDSLHHTNSPSVTGQLGGAEGSDLVWDGLTQTKPSASTFLLKMRAMPVVETNIPLAPCWTLAARMGLQGTSAARVSSSTQSWSISHFSDPKECASVGINWSRRAD